MSRHLDASVAMPAALLAATVTLTALASTGCVTPVDQYNQPARITSVGPVEFDGSALLIHYTLLDPEGQDQTLQVGICPEGEDGGVDCPTPVPGINGDGRSSLPTTPAGEDVSHVLSWNVGCGRVDGDACRQTELETEYVAHLSVEGTDRTVESAPFSLAGLGLDEVPACDTSIRAIPDPCQPDDNESSQ